MQPLCQEYFKINHFLIVEPLLKMHPGTMRGPCIAWRVARMPDVPVQKHFAHIIANLFPRSDAQQGVQPALPALIAQSLGRKIISIIVAFSLKHNFAINCHCMWSPFLMAFWWRPTLKRCLTLRASLEAHRVGETFTTTVNDSVCHSNNSCVVAEDKEYGRRVLFYFWAISVVR